MMEKETVYKHLNNFNALYMYVQRHIPSFLSMGLVNVALFSCYTFQSIYDLSSRHYKLLESIAIQLKIP